MLNNCSAGFDKEVQYVIRRKFGVKVNKEGKIEEKDKVCHQEGPVRNDTFLNRFVHHINFTFFKTRTL